MKLRWNFGLRQIFAVDCDGGDRKFGRHWQDRNDTETTNRETIAYVKGIRDEGSRN